MARRRILRPDERELWQAVAKTARSMHGAVHPPEADPAAVTPSMQVTETAPPPMPEPLPRFRLGQKAPSGAKTAIPAPLTQALRMDAKTHQRMTKGKLAPEARIDLHGMTLAEAYPELIGFLLGAQDRGLRLVLVITGKGKAVFDPVPRPTGALRHQVPHWLRLPPLSLVVQQVTEANLKHGGAGALYVYLRRR